MRLARMASLLVAFYLLTSAATANAECAWVLWGFPRKLYEFFEPTPGAPMTDKLVPVRGVLPKPWIQRAYPTYGDCRGSIPKDPGGALVKSETEGGLARWVEATFDCLPDTVDPRGPKGSGR